MISSAQLSLCAFAHASHKWVESCMQDVEVWAIQRNEMKRQNETESQPHIVNPCAPIWCRALHSKDMTWCKNRIELYSCIESLRWDIGVFTVWCNTRVCAILWAGYYWLWYLVYQKKAPSHLCCVQNIKRCWCRVLKALTCGLYEHERLPYSRKFWWVQIFV